MKLIFRPSIEEVKAAVKAKTSKLVLIINRRDCIEVTDKDLTVKLTSQEKSNIETELKKLGKVKL